MKTFKFRLFPTSAQRTAMNRSLDACRWVYNKTLEVRRDAWQERQESLSLYDTHGMLKQWKQGHPELATNTYSQCLQDAQFRIDLAFNAFFRRVRAGQNPGYPRFRGADRYESFTYPQSGFKLGDRLYLSKIGRVKIKLHRPIEGYVKTLTIRRDAVGNWYACFSCVVEPKPLPVSQEMVGVDLGLTTFAVLSNGETISRVRWAKRDAKDIACLQRKKEVFPKGSPERRKVIRALQHAYQRQTNRRDNFAHQESRKLVNRYGLLVFEKLNIPDMQANGNHVINRGIADVAWGKFVRYAAYKAEWAGRGLLLVNPKGTTQECSGCGVTVPKDLSIRVHDCPHCGLKIGRDLNAARNILARGLASLGTQSLESP